MNKDLLKVFFVLFLAIVVASCFASWCISEFRHGLDQAHQEGMEAGEHGAPVEACPYHSSAGSAAWKRGWIEGFKGAKSCPSAK